MPGKTRNHLKLRIFEKGIVELKQQIRIFFGVSLLALIANALKMPIITTFAPTIIFSVYLPWVTDFFGDFADGGALQPTLYSLAGSPKTAGRDAKRNNYQMKP